MTEIGSSPRKYFHQSKSHCYYSLRRHSGSFHSSNQQTGYREKKLISQKSLLRVNLSTPCRASSTSWTSQDSKNRSMSLISIKSTTPPWNKCGNVKTTNNQTKSWSFYTYSKQLGRPFDHYYKPILTNVILAWLSSYPAHRCQWILSVRERHGETDMVVVKAIGASSKMH